jgi:hypothetical protein
MHEKSFIGGMILVGLVIFLTISMVVQSCQVDYKLEWYEDSDGNRLYTCCYQNSTGYDNYEDECMGAPSDAIDDITQKDLIENIKAASPHIYFILIVILMGLAVIGALLMIG